MIKGKTLRHTLDKFLKNSEVAKEARVQVCLPNGEFYDITGMQLMENKLIGNRESHRLIITIDKERWTMGQVIKFLAPCTKMKNFMKALAACRLQLMA
jgi:hypothetical protein